jgi:Flp pilus assembly protein CpaB
VILLALSTLLAAAAPARMAPALVAGRPLEPGSTITGRDLLTGDLDPTGLGFSPIGDKSQVIGRVVRYRILTGELIRPERLVQAEAGTTYYVPLGLRGVLVGGKLDGAVIGGRVDIVDSARACYVEQLVQVVGLQLDDGSVATVPTEGHQVTAVVVAVTPAQAMNVATARTKGAITARSRTSDEAAQETARCD